LARLAQQERLKEASKEAKELQKLKPKKPQKLRPNCMASFHTAPVCVSEDELTLVCVRACV
jgi:hypothetical protein